MDVCSLKLLYKDTSLEKVSQTEHNVLQMLVTYRILIEIYTYTLHRTNEIRVYQIMYA